MKYPAAATATLLALAATTTALPTPRPPPSVRTFASSSRSSSLSMSTASAPPAEATDATDDRRHPLDPLRLNFEHSWVSQLDTETTENRVRSSSMARCSGETERANKCSRPVFNGHYVDVAPTPLKNPRLVLRSEDMLSRLGLTEEDAETEEFVRYFSGDVEGAFASHKESRGEGAGIDTRTWATPYALSIMGTRYTSNCPFGTGDGYGDGRAISVGEVKVGDGSDPPSRYELQLKGAGRTPFCRGADGRAVLRSSIREFLASEAMHHAGISTTRALSLVVSEGPGGDTSQRPWYSSDNKRQLPSMDDPRLAKYSDAQKRQIIASLQVQSRGNPDMMIDEPCAITCRVAPSFVRIGHIDLFARRATADMDDEGKGPRYDTSSTEWEELEKMIWHAAYREFHDTAYEPFRKHDDIVGAAMALLNESMEGIASMVAGWIRVGFVQGNFNADNCLVGGRTMDYGPFGFVDEYHPLYAKWTGSGEHFGFLNQPNAGFANFAVLVESVMPMIYEKLGEEEGEKVKEETLVKAQKVFERKVDEVFRAKLGFGPDDDSADELWGEAESLLRESRVDWTMFWRKLTEVAAEFPAEAEAPSTAYGDMLETLCGSDEVREGSSPFHEPLDDGRRSRFLKWIESWREALVASVEADEDGAATPAERMRLANPKYVLREWMLVDAYKKASEGDESVIRDLFELVKRPYDEGTEEEIERYYRRAPDEALQAGGTAYMS